MPNANRLSSSSTHADNNGLASSPDKDRLGAIPPPCSSSNDDAPPHSNNHEEECSLPSSHCSESTSTLPNAYLNHHDDYNDVEYQKIIIFLI